MQGTVQAFKPFTQCATRQQRGACSAPRALLSGGGYGGSAGGGNRDQRLIIPGQDSAASRGGGRLVMPGQGGGAPGGGSGGAPPVAQNFRPPPGFMNADGPNADAPELSMSAEEMLNRLRSLSGHWYQLAKLLPALQRCGFDGMAVEEATGLERKVQNVWSTAAQVHDSIKAPGLLSPEALQHFDAEGEYLLYELRFLSVQQRAPVAAYIAENNLSPQECQVLARAVKEHERRNGRKEGFGDTPGDVLAYKYYRDALECRRKEDVDVCAKKGLAVADTDEACAKLNSLLGDQEQGVAFNALPTAVLTMLRMTRDELGYRPLAVAGSLQHVSVDQVLSAPKVSSEGVFGNFRIPPHGAGMEWVALPSWSLLQLAGHPVALTIENCADVEEVRASSSAKTEDELKRLSGQGVLVVDIDAEDKSVQPEKYYLAANGGGVRLMTGSDAAAAQVLGPVLFLCRPPSRESAAATTSELMSL